MPKMNPNDAIGLISEKDLSTASAYAETQSGPARVKNQKRSGQSPAASAIRKSLDRTQRELTSLKEREARRREATPTFYVGEDSIDMVYTGKVAGKAATRHEPIVLDENARLLMPILTPIVSVMNAALRAQRLEENPVINPETRRPAQIDGQTVYKATSLTRAAFAYDALLKNPEFVEQLQKLNDIVDKTYANKGCTPRELKNFTKSSRPGVSAIDKLNAYIASMEDTSKEADDDSPDFG